MFNVDIITINQYEKPYAQNGYPCTGNIQYKIRQVHFPFVSTLLWIWLLVLLHRLLLSYLALIYSEADKHLSTMAYYSKDILPLF